MDIIPQVEINSVVFKSSQHSSDVVLMQEVDGEPGCVRGSIVLLEDVAMVICKEGHNVRS